jgi:L-lactate dehydrogenase complex protein LldE
MIAMDAVKPRVGLFVTCLVDLVRPSVGFAAAKLIEASGCSVDVPLAQTCCGQPAYNSGQSATAADLARQTIRAFAGFDYVVAPSGSCAAMLKIHYPRLLQSDASLQAEAAAFAGRVHELMSFLVNVRRMERVIQSLSARAAYHDSCSGLRELGVKGEPRGLLASVAGIELTETPDCETCCGFGGLFSTKYPEVSTAMGEKKLASAEAAGCNLLLGGDLGCLMHLAGLASRQGRKVSCRHVAEVLAGELADPAIASADEGA